MLLLLGDTERCPPGSDGKRGDTAPGNSTPSSRPIWQLGCSFPSLPGSPSLQFLPRSILCPGHRQDSGVWPPSPAWSRLSSGPTGPLPRATVLSTGLMSASPGQLQLPRPVLVGSDLTRLG